jgi:hypothetical protein
MANEQTSVPLYAASEVLTAANMNISAGTGVPVFATTVTRDAAFGGASEKVLAEGQLCYLSSTNVVQYYDGAAWATVGPAASAAMTGKAYCYFNGTGTPAIYSSVNISSITDNATGDYTFNFTTAIGSANYFFTGMGGKAGGAPSAANSSFPMIETPGYVTSASLRVLYINANGSAFDAETQTIGVFV